MKKIAITLLTLAGICCLSSCGQPPEDPGPVYTSAKASQKTTCRFAVHPLHNPAKLVQAYQPLMAYLNSRLPDVRFILEASGDYAGFEAKFKERRLAFLLPNPWQTLQGINNGYDVIAMAGQPEDFKGIFIIRKNSPIHLPMDLRGKTVSYPAPTALAACIMPQSFLTAHGLDVTSDIKNIYVGSQESAIMNVFLGQSAAGATWPPPWRGFQKDHPEEAGQLKVIWETPHLVNNSVMARNDLPPRLTQQVQHLLIQLHNDPSGVSILKGMETSRFFKADNRTYEVVQTYISTFEKNVRKVEKK